MRMVWAKFGMQKGVRGFFIPRLRLPHVFKTTFICATTLIVHLSILHANEPMGLPKNVCSGEFCGTSQQELWDQFHKAKGLNLDLIPSVYSGICYHKSPDYNPNIPHFVGVLIDKIKGNILFYASIGYFHATQPYANLNIDTARLRFHYAFDVTLHNSFAHAKLSNSSGYRYWLRQAEGSDDLLLVGYINWNHIILCKLDCH